MGAFKRGFHNRNPLILLVAAALLVPALLGVQALFTSGAWTSIPLGRWLRRPTDSFTYVSWTVGHARRVRPQTPVVYITGGSSSREAIVSGDSLAAEVQSLGGPKVAAYDLGFINQNFAESLAVADNVPDTPAWVVIGVNLGRFTATREVNAQQAQGRDLLLGSRVVQRFVSSRWGLEKYSFTIVPGIFAYLSDFLKQDGKAIVTGRAEERTYEQHQYTSVFSQRKKESLVALWNRSRYPVFKQNLASNLQMLGEILRVCKERGVHAVVVELPINDALIGERFDAAQRAYQAPTRVLARRYGAPYVDVNSKVTIPSSDFHDLSHLVAPGRVIWQHALAKELARLMTTTGTGG